MSIPFAYLAMREAYHASDHRWAMVWVLDDDDITRPMPLYVRDLEAWIEVAWKEASREAD